MELAFILTTTPREYSIPNILLLKFIIKHTHEHLINKPKLLTPRAHEQTARNKQKVPFMFPPVTSLLVLGKNVTTWRNFELTHTLTARARVTLV